MCGVPQEDRVTSLWLFLCKPKGSETFFIVNWYLGGNSGSEYGLWCLRPSLHVGLSAPPSPHMGHGITVPTCQSCREVSSMSVLGGIRGRRGMGSLAMGEPGWEPLPPIDAGGAGEGLPRLEVQERHRRKSS